MNFDKANEDAQAQAEVENLKPITFSALEDGVKKWLLIPDTGIIKLLCAAVVANKFKKKPVWLALIAPSGGGKTEFLNGLLRLEDIYEVSTITPQTFLSGMAGRGDTSLLPKLDGKIMLMKDFTSILSMHREARSEIMGQLREIWDGRMKKIFGNGQIRDWKGKVSIILASTQAIDLHQQMHAHLGERFINYRIKMPGRKEVAMRALENDKEYETMQKEIQHLFYAFFKSLDMENIEEAIELPEHVIKELIDLADFCTIARSGVIRDFGPKKEVIFVPAAEMPPRMITQLSSIAAGLTAVNGKFMEQDMKIVYKCALDSIPATNWMVIKELAEGDLRDTAQIAAGIGYPTAPIRTYLENLVLLGVATRVKAAESEEGGTADKWSLKPSFKTIVNRYEIPRVPETAVMYNDEDEPEPTIEEINDQLGLAD